MGRDRAVGPGLDGILVVAKPPGPTSHDIVALVRRLSATKRVGHGGTLDPFASGVLPLFLGRATRMVEYHLGDRKAYRATVCFGATSTTDDLDGELSTADGPPPTRERVVEALATFRGRITQTPPAFSALKVGGRRAYALARAGQTVELKPREVEIHRLDLVEWDGTDAERPIAVLDVECSAGTYVRALARDLGAAVASGAYLGALVRTASGPFRLEDAMPIDDVRAAAADGAGGLAALLRPVDAGLDELPAIRLDADEIDAFARGQHVRPRQGVAHVDGETAVRVLGPAERLLGIGHLVGGRIAPDKVLVEPSAGRAASRIDPVPGVESLRREHGPLFAVVGVFDGLHRGHRYLLDELVRHAGRLEARPAVITFDSHPDEVLVGAAPPLLLDPTDRLRLLREAGVAVVVVQHFDETVRSTTYDDFVGAITERTALSGFLMTPDAAFGHQRRGTPEALAELGATADPPWRVVVVPPFELDGRPVSSSAIRRLVADGELAAAERQLGRPYEVIGSTDPDDPARVTFALPVALPPPGRHIVTVRGTDEGEGRRGAAAIAAGDPGLVVEGVDLPPASRVRIRFVAA